MAEAFLMRRKTAAEVKKQAEHACCILLPVASLETLGAHGPTGLDLSVAEHIGPRIAKETNSLLAPAIPYGDTAEFCGMGVTAHVPERVLEEYCYFVARSLLQTTGARGIVFLNVHALNGFATASACRRLKAEGYACATADWWAAAGSAAGDLLEDGENGRGHGGELITSVALFLDAASVRMEHAVCERPKAALAAVNRWNGTPFRTFGDFCDYCESGAWGELKGASAQKGEEVLARGVKAVADFIREAFGPAVR